MILSGQSIAERKIFTPFYGEKTIASGMSFGLSHCGYDVRYAGKTLLLSRGDFSLGYIMEHITMPLDLCATVMDKSTWARKGLAVQNTIIEPGWRGHLTLELTNHGKETIVIQEGMPICQIVFHLLDRPVEGVGYDGKYQDQIAAPVPAKME